MDQQKDEYYLYIDDSGNRFPDRQQSIDREDGMDHFALGGVLIKKQDKNAVARDFYSFRDKWNITYPLHSTEIRGMRGNYSWLEESSKKKENFLSDLESFLVNIPVIGFAAVVHRPGYNARYAQQYGDKRWWMCKTAYSVLIERVSKYVDSKQGVLHVRFEMCGKREDEAILSYAKELKQTGHPFDLQRAEKYLGLVANDYRRIILGDPKQRTKDNLYIQIADLYLFPMAKRGYDSNYRPWVVFNENEKIIDAFLSTEEKPLLGVKYSCFD